MSLNVAIPDTFNGPLDLLLYLIRKDEMDIYDIPVDRLCNSYLGEMRRLAIVDVDEAAEFFDLASRLLEIKARMLVPDEEEEAPDEEEDFDPRSNLVEALLEYRKFKDVARMLGEMAEEQARRYPRVAPRLAFADGDGAAAADCADLMRAFQKMLLRMMPQDEANVIQYDEIPTSVRARQIETVLMEVESTRFSLLLSGKPDRAEMVGFFIAMLELIRLGKLAARQSADFSDIVLERREPPAEKAAAVPGRRIRARGRFPAAIPGRLPGNAVPRRHPSPKSRLPAQFRSNSGKTGHSAAFFPGRRRDSAVPRQAPARTLTAAPRPRPRAEFPPPVSGRVVRPARKIPFARGFPAGAPPARPSRPKGKHGMSRRNAAGPATEGKA